MAEVQGENEQLRSSLGDLQEQLQAALADHEAQLKAKGDDAPVALCVSPGTVGALQEFVPEQLKMPFDFAGDRVEAGIKAQIKVPPMLFANGVCVLPVCTSPLCCFPRF